MRPGPGLRELHSSHVGHVTPAACPLALPQCGHACGVPIYCRQACTPQLYTTKAQSAWLASCNAIKNMHFPPVYPPLTRAVAGTVVTCNSRQPCSVSHDSSPCHYLTRAVASTVAAACQCTCASAHDSTNIEPCLHSQERVVVVFMLSGQPVPMTPPTCQCNCASAHELHYIEPCLHSQGRPVGGVNVAGRPMCIRVCCEPPN